VILQLLAFLTRNRRPISHHDNIAAAAQMAKHKNCTIIRFRYTNQSDAIFKIKGTLLGEALHQRLDVLLDEHLSPELVPIIGVCTINDNGEQEQENIRLNVV
jgi:hypothetical protein